MTPVIMLITFITRIELLNTSGKTESFCNKIKYEETITEGFENAPQGLRDVLSGKNFGKQLIKVAEE